MFCQVNPRQKLATPKCNILSPVKSSNRGNQRGIKRNRLGLWCQQIIPTLIHLIRTLVKSKHIAASGWDSAHAARFSAVERVLRCCLILVRSGTGLGKRGKFSDNAHKNLKLINDAVFNQICPSLSETYHFQLNDIRGIVAWNERTVKRMWYAILQTNLIVVSIYCLSHSSSVL